jgi:hypothetical protein
MRFAATIFSVAAATVFAVAAAPVAAQVPADMMACVGIARDADRLACFDAALAKASPQAKAVAAARAAESAQIAAAEAAAAATAAKAKAEADAAKKAEAFGGESVASRGKERFAPPEGELQEIETGITEILTNQSGLGVFLLENGQLWRQVDTSPMPRVKDGDRVTITRAPLGGYRLNFLRSKRWVLVKRVR